MQAAGGLSIVVRKVAFGLTIVLETWRRQGIRIGMFAVQGSVYLFSAILCFISFMLLFTLVSVVLYGHITGVG